MKQQYDVMGMTCSACQAAVERAVHKVPGTDNVQVNLLTGKLHVEADETISDQIIAAVEKAGYTASSTSREKTAPSEKSPSR